MSPRVLDDEPQRRQRELRLQIGRLRRRIDRRIRRTGREAERLVSWRTYVRSYPGYAVTAALGVGLAASAGLSSTRLWRWLGLRLLLRSAAGAAGRFWQELRQVWADSAPRSGQAQASGADDDRA
jgi:head-tail adaptor